MFKRGEIVALHVRPAYRRKALLSLNLAARLRVERGQTMAEYAVVLAVITIAVVAILGTLSGSITGQIQSVINVL
jgi:Flp pilus assembly pilin Flp